MPKTAHRAIAVVGIDIGKNSFHVVGLDERGAVVKGAIPDTEFREYLRLVRSAPN